MTVEVPLTKVLNRLKLIRSAIFLRLLWVAEEVSICFKGCSLLTRISWMQRPRRIDHQPNWREKRTAFSERPNILGNPSQWVSWWEAALELWWVVSLDAISLTSIDNFLWFRSWRWLREDLLVSSWVSELLWDLKCNQQFARRMKTTGSITST